MAGKLAGLKSLIHELFSKFENEQLVKKLESLSKENLNKTFIVKTLSGNFFQNTNRPYNNYNEQKQILEKQLFQKQTALFLLKSLLIKLIPNIHLMITKTIFKTDTKICPTMS